METQEPQAPGPDRSSDRTKRVIMYVAIAAVACLVVYFVGLYQGRSAVSEVRAELQQLQEQQTAVQQQLARAQDMSRMRAAQALIYRAALDLDERNFGTANQRLQEAADVLGEAGMNAELQALQQDVAATNLEVAANLDAQRSNVVALAERLNALIPAETVAGS